jgi:hypothetical protein
MTAPKVKPNALPVSFEQFKKNPIAAVSFCMLLAVSYLYMDLRSGYALKRSDSCLASAMTEIRIMQTMKKL